MKKQRKTKKMTKLSIVIPVFNERKQINEVIDQARKQRINGFETKEIIVIDDCSTDGTKKILQSLKTTKYLKIIFRKKNEGKGAALKVGFTHTSGDIVIVQDADLEYSPADYNALIEPFARYNADVVYGSRFSIYKPHRVMYFWHNVTNIFLTTLSNIFTDLNLTDMETGFKCFKGDLIRNIAPKLESKRFGFEPEITAKISKIKSLRIYEVGISYEGRTYEEGKKIVWLDGLKAIYEILRFNLFD